MSTEKRDPKTDIPRRIYKTTIDRIDKHLEKAPREVKSGKRKTVKGNFNEFLVHLLDTYETLQNAQHFYANKLYDDVSEARGDAIKESIRNKTKVKWPSVVVVMGEDEA